MDGERIRSGKKIDHPKSIKDSNGNIIKEFPHVSKEHGFPDIIDNYSRYADEFSLVGEDGVKRRLFHGC